MNDQSRFRREAENKRSTPSGSALHSKITTLQKKKLHYYMSQDSLRWRNSSINPTKPIPCVEDAISRISKPLNIVYTASKYFAFQ